jgi:tetratricopeptide (TPR) repeat protein
MHEALGELARNSPGVTMNDLVVAGVRKVLDDREVTVVANDMSDVKLDFAIAAVGGETAVLFGIARHYANLGRLNLACVLYFCAAEQVAQRDPKEAARNVVRTADLAPTRPLEVALLRAALRWNPNNDVAKNRLGQLLVWEGEFEEAKGLLESVVDRDNHARLWHGWALLRLAQKQGSRSAVTRARGEIAAALQTWAFGEGNPEERKKWLNQVGNLAAEGDEFDQCVTELLDYANDNSRWDTVNLESVAQARRSGGSRPSESESA